MNDSILRSTCALALFAMIPACGRDAVEEASDRFTINVAPLELVGVTDAFYTLRIYNGATPPALVSEVEHLTSTRYGDAKGSIAYVATCDASDGASENRVELTLEKLVGPEGDLAVDSYRNPAPASAPVSIVASCAANSDTRVDFNLVIARSADQGFFDIAVEFEDVFCSAKFDCQDKDGGPLDLLHRPGGDRDRTLVMGFACTSGASQPTWLHMSDVLVECGTAPDISSYWLNPAQVPDGNAGGVDPIFYQTAIYRGAEQLPELDKCYWNMAFGIDQVPAAASCRVIASGTASSVDFGASGATPANTVYPYVSFDIPITDATGAVMCTDNPMDRPGSKVTTKYTGVEGTRFPHSWQCGETPTTDRIACSGAIDAVGATFTESPDGIAVSFGNATTDPTSARFTLPDGLGLRLSSDCCMNPCCTDP